ncbi:DUF924 family protein [Sphingomonas sp.]|uniref:DUF924 family protein n=1 Tax=Sphingomonas sp. TaxID=28214 RepID=UPI002DD62836|nr:DUF924 family protein [Sphingomonas sp.]
MTEHLGPGTGEVHDAARQVLDFWFGLTTEQQFAKDDAMDREIAERFGAMRQDVLDADALGWRGEPETILAAIILLDQFSRNIFRGQARAFEADPLALSLTHDAIDRQWDGELPQERAVFLLMPLMHAEHADAQALSVAKFEALGLEVNARFARDHRDVFERFGRFPGRNTALGRASTPEEIEYLSQPGAGW